jgi:hypothetical protein
MDEFEAVIGLGNNTKDVIPTEKKTRRLFSAFHSHLI